MYTRSPSHKSRRVTVFSNLRLKRDYNLVVRRRYCTFTTSNMSCAHLRLRWQSVMRSPLCPGGRGRPAGTLFLAARGTASQPHSYSSSSSSSSPSSSSMSSSSQSSCCCWACDDIWWTWEARCCCCCCAVRPGGGPACGCGW